LSILSTPDQENTSLNGLTLYEVFYRMTGVDLESMAYSKLTSGAIEV